MKNLSYLNYFLFFVLTLFSMPQGQTYVPEFTPNVVDPHQYLSHDDREEINKTIDTLRTLGIWAAVYVTEKLNGEPIESLAERAFSKWELGEKEKDNGLLLVLAIEDRKSRFEVGYSLEADFTDILTFRVLNEVLAPEMRKGDIKNAIINSLNALGAKGTTINSSSDTKNSNNLSLTKEGVFAYFAYLVLLWGTRIAIFFREKTLSKHFMERFPNQIIPTIDSSDSNKKGSLPHTFRRQVVLLLVFFSLNPGCFIIVLSCLFPAFAYGSILTCFIISYIYYYQSLKKYSSNAAYLHYIETKKKELEQLLSEGSVKQISPTRFKYTKAYLASHSRSGSSSRSSSSGGGRSGGGGSSSSW